MLRASLASLGHALLAYNDFARLKSSRLSPDGSLGGRGYIQKIQDMRKQYMNCVEALSSLSDTLYDELNAPHWALVSRQEDDQERAEVEAIINDALFIREDPEDWAQREMVEEFGDDENEDAPAEEEEEEEMVMMTEEPEFGQEIASGDDEKEGPGDPPPWMQPPAFLGKHASVSKKPKLRFKKRRASRKTAQDIRLELAALRIAEKWAQSCF